MTPYRLLVCLLEEVVEPWSIVMHQSKDVYEASTGGRKQPEVRQVFSSLPLDSSELDSRYSRRVEIELSHRSGVGRGWWSVVVDPVSMSSLA
jgi:hypothetical protein